MRFGDFLSSLEDSVLLCIYVREYSEECDYKDVFVYESSYYRTHDAIVFHRFDEYKTLTFRPFVKGVSLGSDGSVKLQLGVKVVLLEPRLVCGD